MHAIPVHFGRFILLLHFLGREKERINQQG
jgi:hypothetical protein